MDVNSRKYWENRFSLDWDKKEGREQTRFFCEIALRHIPHQVIKDIKENALSVSDWGCAQGECVNLMSKLFRDSRVTGIDFSQRAIEKAKGNFPENDFFCFDIDDMKEKYDVLFSSNTLEHFDNPLDIAEKLIKYAKKYFILLLPFQENNRIEEHLFTFDYSNLPMKIKNFYLLCFREIDCENLEGTYWSGKQALLIYANEKHTDFDSVPLSYLTGDFIGHEEYSDHVEQKASLKTLDRDSLESRLVRAESEIKRISEDQGSLESRIASAEAERDGFYRQLLDIYASDFWKVASFYWRIRDKFFKYPHRFLSTWKREGAKAAIGKLFERLTRAHDSARDRLKSARELQSILDLYYSNKPAEIIIYPPCVDWNVPLYQRPHHIATKLSEFGHLVFYCTTNQHDRTRGFQELKSNLYLTDKFDLLIERIPGAWIIMHAADPTITLDDIQNYRGRGLKLIYEYMDEIHPDIVGSAGHIAQRHRLVSDRQFDAVITTSTKLFREMERVVSKEKLLLNPNGVDYGHFHIKRDKAQCPEEMKDMIDAGKTIIGYHGALAKWIDYSLLNHLARKRPEWQLVLIGWDFDETMRSLGNWDNIKYLGVKQYQQLPAYAIWFDVAIIPFKDGEVAKATSPIKLFEYMAMNKPVVVTRDLVECRRYEGVLVGTDKDEFIIRIEEALMLKDDPAYLSILDRQARENTWDVRARQIEGYIRKVVPAP